MRPRLRAALAVAFVLGMCALCVRLGFWQLDRLAQRRARNHALEAALRLPVLQWDAATAAALERDPARFINRRLHASGQYQPAGEVILRGRALDGAPGVHLVTPLRAAGVGVALLVNRGWAPSPDAATLDPAPWAEAGTVSVDGILQEVPRHTLGGGQPATQHLGAASFTSFRRLDLDVLRARSSLPLAPLYLQQLPRASPAPHHPVPVALPPLDNGPHLSYAVQWFSFAAIGLVGMVVVALRRRSAARR